MQMIHGVTIEPSNPYKNQDVSISYDGLLKQSGADCIYLHYGVDDWQNTSTVEMMRLPSGNFQAVVKGSADYELNFCFHDSAMNWDNNNGIDWAIRVF
ncbi:MAG: carbohydrate-binding protein [Firmicutes bacterium]|nr:carbohydrate-binding protein [Bacillota bacterium]